MDLVARADAQERFAATAAVVADPVRRYLLRRTDPASAEDVLGETLLVCWRRFEEVPADAVPWAIGVARNCLANARRAAGRRSRLLVRIRVLDPPRDVEGPGPGTGGRDEEVRAALARLRPRDAEVLRLWAWEELPPREIAVVLGVSVDAATVRLHRAKRRLREALSEPDGSRTGTGGRGTT